jgi:drug/metabolite transporter (DMT)-like permease
VAIALALAAALAFAVASVSQQHAAARVPVASENAGAMARRLASDRTWWAGTGADVTAVGLQAAALRAGPMVVVQPVLAMGLIAALGLNARLHHRRYGPTVMVPAMALVLAMPVFIIVAAPHGGSPSPSTAAWLWSALVCLGGAAIVIGASTVVSSKRLRAGFLALATGLIYGLAAALTKFVVDHLDGRLFSTWQPYALAVVAGLGLWTGQRAFQVAPLGASLPTLTATEPVVGAALGIWLFNEHLSTAGIRGGILFVATITMIVSVLLVARRSDEVTLATTPRVDPEPVAVGR